jgi:CheY-specific phosphatase CheX
MPESSIKKEELRELFCDAFCKSVNTMMATDISKENIIENNDTNFEISGGMILSGENNRNMLMVISTTKASATYMVQLLTGLDEDDITDDDRMSTVVELVNITAGIVKVEVADTDSSYLLTLPFAVTGSGLTWKTDKALQRESFFMEYEGIKTRVCVYHMG